MLAVSGGIAVGAFGGPGLGLANAYPPEPTPPGNVEVDPGGPAPGIVQQVPGVDELPDTGNSDVAQTLMIAAATLVTGLGITVVSRRRTSATVDTAVKPD